MQVFHYLCTEFFLFVMENTSIEMALLEPEERELVEFIFRTIPAFRPRGETDEESGRTPQTTPGGRLLFRVIPVLDAVLQFSVLNQLNLHSGQ